MTGETKVQYIVGGGEKRGDILRRNNGERQSGEIEKTDKAV